MFPFRAYRYNPAKTDPARVLTQPYDKITPEMQKRYAAASPYNSSPLKKARHTRTTLRSNDVYDRGRTRSLEDWITAKILVQDPSPAFYAYFQEFEVPGTTQRNIRKGLIALSRLEDYSAGVVFRHEQTLAGPKADRLELFATHASHTGQLFMLYDDPARRAGRNSGRRHGKRRVRLWTCAMSSASSITFGALMTERSVSTIQSDHGRQENS